MFEKIEIWDSKEALAQLRNAGVTANKETIIKARRNMGVESRARHIKGKSGVDGWDWIFRSKHTLGDDDDA
jgi:hypothetical protein